MQQLLASLVVSMGVKDAAFQAGMRNARAEAARTEQDFDRAGKSMAGAIDRTAHRVNEAAVRIADGVAGIGREVRNAGLALTAGLTLPAVALGAASKKSASDFQAAMARVRAAMLDASPDDLDKLRQAAMDLGPAMGKSAIEAAGAIEALAKNGMTAANILGGGLESALKLGVAGQTDLGKASDATTDILQQFHLAASDLPGVVDKVSGALDASKLSFDGYADAIGQVGGIAGGLGYSFEDMNAALAAVIPLMTGGSDAGTSFKTFLLSLVPTSKEAERTMEQLGISFFNADGSAKSLSEVAEVLNTRLSGLSQRSRQDALTRMFGTDGMRVAIALMQAGAKGIADVKAQIDKASVDQKLAVLLDGEAAATQRLASAWEKLKIAIGEAGILQVLTWVKNGVADVVETVASAPPAFFYMVTAAGVAAAALGPLVLIGTKLLPVVALLVVRNVAFAGSLGVLGTAATALLNPLGFLIRLLGQLALMAGVNSMLGRAGAAMLRFAGPIGIAATALTILLPLFWQGRQASEQYAKGLDEAKAATAASADLAMKLAFAQGKARQQALALARADRLRAIEAVKAARADLAAARAANVRARTASQTTLGKINDTLLAPQKTIAGWFGIKSAPDRMQTAVDFQAAAQTLQERLKGFDAVDRIIKDAEASTGGAGANVSFDDEDEKKAKGPKGKSAADLARDAARNEAQFRDEIGRARVAQLQAQADLTGSIDARYRAEMAGIDEDRASYVRQNAIDEGLTDARRAELLASKDAELATRRMIVEQDRANGVAQQSFDLLAAENDLAQDRVRAEIDASDSIGARRAGELRLLDLQRAREEAELELILATKNSVSVEWANAMKRKEALDGVYGARRDAAMRQNERPGAALLRDLNRSGAALGEDIEAAGVSALRDLNSELTDAVMNTKNLGDAFASTARRIVASLLDIAIQQMVIKPLAGALFGGSSISDTQLGASIVSNANSALASLPGYGGARAAGGRIEPNKWYMVGEQGPEPFFAGVGGQILPNDALGGGRRGGGDIHQHFTVPVGTGIVSRDEMYQFGGAVKTATLEAMRQGNMRRG